MIELRKAQATLTGNAHYFRQFIGTDGYQDDESTETFQRRHGILGVTLADPELMPYYLLIVGDPRRIPFRFQYEMDVVYAVGRLHFDAVYDYATYALNVVWSETLAPPATKRAVFFGAEHQSDLATGLSSKHLVRPLAGSIKCRFPVWEVDQILGPEANRAKLLGLVRDDPTSFLFTATHGMAFATGNSLQLPDQALCSAPIGLARDTRAAFTTIGIWPGTM